MKYLLIIAAVSLLAACDHPVPPPPTQQTFTGGPYVFNVASIKVADDYISPRTPPHVEHLFTLTPAQAVKQWVKTRMAAAGTNTSLEVDIEDASVIEKDIPKQKTGIEGFFTKEQTEEYDGTLEVELKLYNGHKILPVAHARVSAHQVLTLREDATLLDREALYREMTTKLMNALDSELDKNIHQYFANYLM